MTILAFVLVALMVFANGFFVIAEYSLVRSRRSRLEELREDIGKRVSEAVDERAEQDFRVAAVDAAAEAATVEIPVAVVSSTASRSISDVLTTVMPS